MANDKKKYIFCTCCGEKKQSKYFYESQSELYKSLSYLPICKDCIGDIYKKYEKKYKNDKEIIYNFCRLFDLPFSYSDFDGAVQHSTKTGWKLYQSYFKQINSFGGVNSVGRCFEDGESLIEDNVETIEDSTDKNSGTEDILENIGFKITPEVELFWGRGFEKEEYFYLESFYNDFVNNYECDTPAQVLLFKNAAKTQLNADKALEQGNINLYDKLMKTLSTILGDSNIKPVQETGANATEQATFGTLIKKWENEKPIPEPLDEWKIKNWLEYIKIWFVSHLAKMTNAPNPYMDEYEEKMKEFRVELPSKDTKDDE
jgi:hypothetical protein